MQSTRHTFNWAIAPMGAGVLHRTQRSDGVPAKGRFLPGGFGQWFRSFRLVHVRQCLGGKETNLRIVGLHASAQNRYRLFANGLQLDRGRGRCGRFEQFPLQQLQPAEAIGGRFCQSNVAHDTHESSQVVSIAGMNFQTYEVVSLGPLNRALGPK